MGGNIILVRCITQRAARKDVETDTPYGREIRSKSSIRHMVPMMATAIVVNHKDRGRDLNMFFGLDNSMRMMTNGGQWRKASYATWR